jgi:hypothetical protein
MNKKLLPLLLAVAACSSPKSVVIKYPDQNFPGKSPAVFAPGVISQPKTREGALSFSPDGKELFFTQSSADGKKWPL